MAGARIDVWPELSKRLGIDVVSATTSVPTLATSGTTRAELFRPHCDGARTNALVRIVGHLLNLDIDVDTATSICLNWNAQNTPPLPEAKVVSTCQSIGAKDAREHPKRQRTDRSAAPTLPLEPLFDIQSANVEKFLRSVAPPRRWVLKDYLPFGIVAAIIAPGGTGKSQLLMQLAYAVATGTLFAGYWTVSEPGRVLMLCAEDDVDEIHRRLSRINERIFADTSFDHTTQLTDRLFIRSMVGEDVLMTSVAANHEAVRTSFVDRLVLTAAQVQDLKLIIIDPASRFRGGEENSNPHATRFVQALEALSQRTGATVLVAHHTNKAASYGTGEPNQNSSRGASALTDAVRLQLSLTPVPKPKGGRTPPELPSNDLLLSVVKTNYTAPQAAARLRREEGGYLEFTVDDGTQTDADKMMQFKLLQVVAGSKKPLTARKIEDHFCGPGKAITISQKSLRSVIEQARRAGLITAEPRKAINLTDAGRISFGRTWSSSAAPRGKMNAAKKDN